MLRVLIFRAQNFGPPDSNLDVTQTLLTPPFGILKILRNETCEVFSMNDFSEKNFCQNAQMCQNTIYKT